MSSRPHTFEGAVREDNSLFDIGWFLSWRTDAPTATIDGEFSAEDLRRIADHMVKHATPKRG